MIWDARGGMGICEMFMALKGNDTRIYVFTSQ